MIFKYIVALFLCTLSIISFPEKHNSDSNKFEKPILFSTFKKQNIKDSFQSSTHDVNKNKLLILSTSKLITKDQATSKNQSSSVQSNANYFNCEIECLSRGTDNEVEIMNAKSFNLSDLYIYSLNYNHEVNQDEYFNYFYSLPNVCYVGYDSIDVLTTSEIDNQWGLTSTSGINAEGARSYTKGDKDVIVGVMDTGIQNHKDLSPNIVGRYDVNPNDEFAYMSDHGTHIAGIIAAAENNEGIVGVAPNIKLFDYDVFDGYLTELNNQGVEVKRPGSSQSGRIKALEHATRLRGTNKQISIINHSVGGYGDSKSLPLLAAISKFPGLFVWSAGNNGAFVDTFPNIKDFHLNNLISVGNINSNKELYETSNYGNDVDIYAPGTNIYSTSFNDKYRLGTGTSMAAPHVSGVAALLCSYTPGMTAYQMKLTIVNKGKTHNFTQKFTSHSVKLLDANSSLYEANKYYTKALAPIRIQLVGNERNVRLINVNKTKIIATYNKMLAFLSDAKSFSNLKDLEDIVIPAKSSETVTITGNYSADAIVAATKSEYSDFLLVSSCNGLSNNNGLFSTNQVFQTEIRKTSTLTKMRNLPSYLHLQNKGKKNNDWYISVTNYNDTPVLCKYNKKMCFFEDAKSFSNLSDIETITINSGSTINLLISPNWFATSVTVCFEVNVNGLDRRYISYGDNLNNNALNQYNNKIYII